VSRTATETLAVRRRGDARLPARVSGLSLVLASPCATEEHGRILLGLAVVLAGAKLFAALVERFGQAAVLDELRAVGVPAILVAIVGVVFPMGLGFGVGRLLRPQDSWMANAFIGAMLAATPVGITARVLQDAKAIRTPAARIILGAAVIDDVLSLLVLVIISGVFQAAAGGASLDAVSIAAIVAKAPRLPGSGRRGGRSHRRPVRGWASA